MRILLLILLITNVATSSAEEFEQETSMMKQLVGQWRTEAEFKN